MSVPSTDSTIVHVTGTPTGVLRLWVPTGVTVSKGDLISRARKLAGTVDVGRVPAGKGAKLHGVQGTGYDFAPVVHRNANATASPDSPAESDPFAVARAALMQLPGMTADAANAMLSGQAPAEPAKRTGKAKGKAPVNTFVRDVLAPKRIAQDKAAKACGTCLGFGKARTMPHTRKDGTAVRFPLAFRNQRGADTSPTGIVCPECKGKSRRSA